MSREIKTFLEECRRPDSVSSVDPVTTRKDFIKTIKEWKETTSTSPSGRAPRTLLYGHIGRGSGTTPHWSPEHSHHIRICSESMAPLGDSTHWKRRRVTVLDATQSDPPLWGGLQSGFEIGLWAAPGTKCWKGQRLKWSATRAAPVANDYWCPSSSMIGERHHPSKQTMRTWIRMRLDAMTESWYRWAWWLRWYAQTCNCMPSKSPSQHALCDKTTHRYLPEWVLRNPGGTTFWDGPR